VFFFPLLCGITPEWVCDLSGISRRAPDSKNGVQAMRGVYLSATLGIVAFLLGLFVG